MTITLKILILIALVYIAIQDFKERKVYILLFIILGLLLIFYKFQTSFLKVFLIESFYNLILIGLLIGALIMYSNIKLKTNLFSVFGIGDLLFFIAIAFGFDTVPFLIYFVFSLIFSLLIFFVLKNKMNYKTVPLAGLQSLFFFAVFIVDWFF